MQTKKIELKVDDLRKNFNLFIATPMYGGNCLEPYFRSCIKTVTFFNKHQIPLAFGTIANESLIPRARNVLLSYFLNSKCTHLLFIDGDIGFQTEDILKLYAHNKDIVVGAYPKKGLAWDKIRLNILANSQKEFTNREIAAFGSDYAVNFKFHNKKEKTIEIRDGLIPLHDASTGFMMIKREAILKMIEEYPELKYKNDINLSKDLDDKFYALFDTMIDPDDRRYLSEDYTFTRRWQKLGGDVYLDPTISLDHYGHFQFCGNPSAIINFNQSETPKQQVKNSKVKKSLKTFEVPEDKDGK